MINQYMDFDAMFSEMKAETIPFKIFGKEYHIRKEIPAFIVLEMSRHENDDTISNMLTFKAARYIFGENVLDEICQNPGFSAEKLSQMIKWAFEAINGKVSQSEDVTEDDFGVKKGKN